MWNLQACAQVSSGIVCTILAGASACYMMLFYTGVYDGISINNDVPAHQPALINRHPLLNNLLLLLLFFCSHSILARDWMKRGLSCFLSPSLYRHFYFLVSSVTLFLVVYGWTPLPHVLWNIVSVPLLTLVYGIQISGGLLIVVSFFSINPLEFCGLLAPIQQLTGTSNRRCHTQAKGGGENELIVTGVYGLVRHPMYTGLLLLLWSTPYMTQGQLLLVSTSTLYLFLVVPLLEEADLIEHFGPRYNHYMSTTGMFFPYLFPSINSKKS